MKALELETAALSRVPEVVTAYEADPIVHHAPIDTRTAYEILRAIEWVQPNLSHIELPFLTAHGTEDRLAPCEGAQMLYERAASKDKTLHLYDGAYHELFNDLVAEQFFADLLDWLRSHT
jgi:alpha-beta hydrolase superfamily lysophospholipase